MGTIDRIYSNIMENMRTVGVTVDALGYVTITGFPFTYFKVFLKQEYNVSGFLDRLVVRGLDRSIYFHQWFIPELHYLLVQAVEKKYIQEQRAATIIEELYQHTWYGSTCHEYKSEVDRSEISKQMPGLKLLKHQEEFVFNVYSQKKQQYQLNGYLLALPPGGGKTATSLALSCGLKAKHVVIIAPLSVAKNVWPTEIRQWFKDERKIWTVDMPMKELDENTEFAIMNYDSIGKYADILSMKFRPGETMVIVDECHNFKDYKAKRTQELVSLCKDLASTDILLMSGTPLKALVNESIPIFQLLDPYFDEFILGQMKVLGRYPSVMNQLLHNRLGMLMYRKLKTEILDLPPLHEEELKISIPTGKQYTLPVVQELVLKFADDRREYYRLNFERFVVMYENALQVFEKTLESDREIERFNRYKRITQTIRKANLKSTRGATSLIPLIEEANQYEKKVIIPKLPGPVKREFKVAKSVVKYVELKIMGEVLGKLLVRLRIQMTTEMIDHQVFEIIKNAEKKTIVFTSYLDTIEAAEAKCKKLGLAPLSITGANSDQAKELIAKFKASPKLNPLIASLNVMATGHTITEANTVIFLNVPFRSVDYEQARDRCWRYGQDTDVYSYKLVLDTGDVPNLSTRMQDILAWSKAQFDAIVDGIEEADDKDIALVAKAMGSGNLIEAFDSLSAFVSRIAKKLF